MESPKSPHTIQNVSKPTVQTFDWIEEPVSPLRFGVRERPEMDEKLKERSVLTKIVHSFKRADAQNIISADTERGIPPTGDSSLHRKLGSVHIQMIAIGGAIGAGLFIGSGSALATGGPGTLILDFGIIGIMLFCTVNALGELATLFPVNGSGPSSQS